uniref:Phorbol-ester/DAG-type domain-containing protein n=1 Tax=Pavo cristatus TaxID=9049 RepID=A0A8C9FWF3_PAVCR
MDSDSDSPFNYSWPSLPKMRIRRRASKHSTLDVLKKLKTPPTFFAAARLSTMLNGSDEVYANCMLVDQVKCMVIKYCVVCFSSSLDDLEVNSRSEGVLDRSSIPHPLLEHPEVKACSTDGLDSSEMSISQTESLPLSISPQPKECSPSGIRSRSYSCSSPKDSLGRPRIPQDFTIGDSGEERAYSLPEHSREKRIQEEEWDKYIVPSKTESEKYKVSRTFSFLMNRMTSTRNKYKTKNKDTKDKEKLNRHNFVNGTFSGIMPCMACEKALLGKESLQCSCNVIVHKNCKDVTLLLMTYCTLSKCCFMLCFTDLSFGDISQPGISSVHPSSSVPIGLSAGRREALQQSHSLSKSVPGTSFERRSMPFPEQDSEASTWRTKSRSEEMLQALGTYSSMDSFVMEVEVDSSQWTDISSDAHEFEAESWSLVVDPMFCNKQEKDVAKRQDVIFGQYIKASCRFKTVYCRK